VDAIRRAMQPEPDEGGEVERLAKLLAAHIPPEGHEWLACLAAYLAECSAEEAEKLADAIRAAKNPPGSGQRS